MASSSNLYEDSSVFRFAGSMEGVPDPEPVGAGSERIQALMDRVAALLPGVALALLLALGARGVADGVGVGLLGFERSPISPILFAVVLGLALRAAVGFPGSYDVGLRFCVQKLLRVGVALLGLRLSLEAVGTLGLMALPVVLMTIASALVIVALATRALGLPARLGTLIAVGTAICGNSAVLATGPLLGARDDEVSYAVGCVTLFGLVALLVHPFVAHALFEGSAQPAGMFLGVSIHDTAQVAGAGLLYLEQFGAPEALDAAMVTKLLRNLFLVAVVPGVALLHRGRGAGVRRPKLSQAVPGFVLGFLALVVLRTLGDLGPLPFGGLLSAEAWSGVLESGARFSGWLLVLAMAAVGLGTDLRSLRRLGVRPLLVGFVAALVVGGVGALLIGRVTA